MSRCITCAKKILSLAGLAGMWLLLAATGPRNGPAVADDVGRGLLVLFGGESEAGFVADTWEWNGSAWTRRRPPTSPGARYLHAMAYDAARRRVVLFGGGDGVAKVDLGDTWEWDGKTWTKQLPTTSPSARGTHAMAYDAARRRIVLFGGYGAGVIQGDTWEWDGKTWTKQLPTTSPSARGMHSMAYDSARKRVVLFGGRDSRGFQGDTWEWDGKTWLQRSAKASPDARGGHALAYHPQRRRVVLFGGVGDGGLKADTWEWDGRSWTQPRPAASPSARVFHALAYFSKGNAAVLVGGRGATDGTWLWNGATWRPAAAAGAQPIRLTDFHEVRLPAGGRPYGPEAMRKSMLTVHYPQPQATVVGSLRKQLQADGWKTDRTKTDGTTITLLVSKGGRQVSLMLLHRSSTETVIMVTRGVIRDETSR